MLSRRKREQLPAIRGLPILSSDRIAEIAARLAKMGRALMVARTDAPLPWQLFDEVAAAAEAANYQAGILYAQAIRAWRRALREETEARAEKWWQVAATLLEVVWMDRGAMR